MSDEQQIHLFGQIHTSQTGGQRYSDTSPYKVSEYILGLDYLVEYSRARQDHSATFLWWSIFGWKSKSTNKNNRNFKKVVILNCLNRYLILGPFPN